MLVVAKMVLLALVETLHGRLNSHRRGWGIDDGYILGQTIQDYQISDREPM
jgi:hypothetical protein